MNLHKLAAPLPLEAIHWRAGSITKKGDKAMALAYLDARDVMDRLDEVCGPANWQNEYREEPSGRVMCRIGIRVDGEWTWKGDGAGSTDVEGEKGGISDALKRAAVPWGVGRYLYRLPAPWVPCECYENGTDKYGKTRWAWRRWTANPWDFVRNIPSPEKPDAAPQSVNGPGDPPPQSDGLGGGWWDNIMDANGFDGDSDTAEVAKAAADVICEKIVGYKTLNGLTNYGEQAKASVEWVKRHNPEEGSRISTTYRTQLEWLRSAKEQAA